jgi:hypothetical protein
MSYCDEQIQLVAFCLQLEKIARIKEHVGVSHSWAWTQSQACYSCSDFLAVISALQSKPGQQPASAPPQPGQRRDRCARKAC